MPPAPPTPPPAAGTPAAGMPGSGAVVPRHRRRSRTSQVLPGALADGLLGAVVALALAGGAQAGRPALVAVLVPVQAALALAWLAYVGAPAQLSGALLAGGAGLAGDVLAARRATEVVGALAGVLALCVVAAVAVQLLRRRRLAVTEALAAHVSGVLLCVSPALLVGLCGGNIGRDAAVAGLVGLAAGALVGRPLGVLLRRPALATDRGLAGLLGWAGAAALAAGALLGRDGLLLGAAAGGCAGLTDLAGAGVADRLRALLLGAALPVAAAAPAIYVLGRVLRG